MGKGGVERSEVDSRGRAVLRSALSAIKKMIERTFTSEGQSMQSWFFYAVGAAVLYGAHQIFTKLASDRISDGLGGFVVEASAAATILLYLGYLRYFRTWNQNGSVPGIYYSVVTGVCVGAGTIFF